MQYIVHWILRLFFGITITLAALGKMLDLPGFIGVIETYQFHLPLVFHWVIGITVTVVELVLGIWLLSGYKIAQAAMGSVVMHVGYAFVLAVTFYRGIVLANCGCFGVFFPKPLQWYTPLQDLFFALLSFVLYLLVRKVANKNKVQPL